MSCVNARFFDNLMKSQHKSTQIGNGPITLIGGALIKINCELRLSH